MRTCPNSGTSGKRPATSWTASRPIPIRSRRKERAFGQGPAPISESPLKWTIPRRRSSCGTAKPRLAVVREEGTNSDREMSSAFHLAGFEVWDISMSDLLADRIRLDGFHGLGFPGGFAYADVLDSAKGWSGVIRFNENLLDQFQRFHDRENTFSLGICNGCQLSALLGWVPWDGIETRAQPRFIQNSSGRFESRFATVQVMDSPAVMLKGMAGSRLGIWVAHGEGQSLLPGSRDPGEGPEPGVGPCTVR